MSPLTFEVDRGRTARRFWLLLSQIKDVDDEASQLDHREGVQGVPLSKGKRAKSDWGLEQTRRWEVAGADKPYYEQNIVQNQL